MVSSSNQPPSQDQFNVINDPARSWINKIGMLLASLAANCDPLILKELEKTLDEVVPSLGQANQTYPHINALVKQDALVTAAQDLASDDGMFGWSPEATLAELQHR
jgi:hypothetical protein